ncbi:hypothetical protein FKP32DRAFT_1565063 [Trametes sanguinea]|nr:hypothetical protein FKP32DRAFT_1565063 [Trametes sanguinea]
MQPPTSALPPYGGQDTVYVDPAPQACEACAETVKLYSTAMIKRWKEEIDTLLVYAGLFSAVLTAFNVEAYTLLQSEPTDGTNALLLQISMQLTNISVGTTVPNPSQAFTSPVLGSSFRAPSSAVWINAVWFASLVCSLSSAFVGMAVKQWLHEAELGLFGTSREVARLRQYRYDSLVKWRVGTIVASLPLLLQIASALFFAGLLILLWTLHPGVAALASVLVGVLALFTVFTVLAPSFSSDCCYRSPQAQSVFVFTQTLCQVVMAIQAYVTMRVRYPGSAISAWFWGTVNRGLGIISFKAWRKYPSWPEVERGAMRNSPYNFDRHIIEVANAIVMSNTFFDRVVRPCVRTLPWRHALASFRQLLRPHADIVPEKAPGGGIKVSNLRHITPNVCAELTLDIIKVYAQAMAGEDRTRPMMPDASVAMDMETLLLGPQSSRGCQGFAHSSRSPLVFGLKLCQQTSLGVP